MAKSPEAFRTISEVAEWLGVQAHVLRFWESKFSQVKPIKRAGGRRYYRPTDMLLLGGIKRLLHDDGLTIKGVQKLLREEGMSYVSDLSQPLDDGTLGQLDDMPGEVPEADEVPEDRGVVLEFTSPTPSPPEPAPETEEPDADEIAEEDVVAAQEGAAEPEDTVAQRAEPAQEPERQLDMLAEPKPEDTAEREPELDPQVDMLADPEPEAQEEMPPASPAPEPQPEPLDTQPVGDAPAEDAPDDSPAPLADLPSFLRQSPASAREEPVAEPETTEAPAPASELPAFLRQPMAETDTSEPPKQDAPSEPEAAEPAAPAPSARNIDIPPFTPEADFLVAPAALSASYSLASLSAAQAAQIAPLIDRLTALRDDMNAQRRSVTRPPE
ncbi:MAG: MerR family transcriptional regulator [Pseudomonadota bacterium]